MSFSLWGHFHDNPNKLPYNCFTLDLTKNAEVQQKGVRELQFLFPVKENTSVRVIPIDKELACNRGVKFLKFYSSGDQAIINNLGEAEAYKNVLSKSTTHKRDQR